MEKRSPHYKLNTIKDTFQKMSSLRLSVSADHTCFKLGFKYKDLVFVIQSLTQANFYKSMTTYADHRVWQDVYHFEYKDIPLYIKDLSENKVFGGLTNCFYCLKIYLRTSLKFMVDSEGYLIVSFKER